MKYDFTMLQGVFLREARNNISRCQAWEVNNRDHMCGTAVQTTQNPSELAGSACERHTGLR